MTFLTPALPKHMNEQQLAQLTYSAAVMQAFAGTMERVGMPLPMGLSLVSRLDPAQRLDAVSAHRVLREVDRSLDSEHLGARAAMLHEGWSTSILHCLMQSAGSAREAIEAARAYLRLWADVWSLSVEVTEGRTELAFTTLAEVPRVAEDFVVAAIARQLLLSAPLLRESMRVSVRRPVPSDVASYARWLGVAAVEFDAEVAQISLDSELLDRPLPMRDRRLHALLRDVADRALAELPPSLSWTARVREALHRELCKGNFALDSVASTFGVHYRKLGRALAREGTSYQRLVDDVRRSLSLDLLARSDRTIAEIAQYSGFSSKAPFHRAFRRWTGKTPREYRKSCRGHLRVAEVSRYPTSEALGPLLD